MAFWTDEEVAILREENQTYETIRARLPRRSRGAIRTKRNKMGLKLNSALKVKHKKTGMWFNCEFCGEKSYKHPSRNKRNVKNHFCSLKCRDGFRQLHPELYLKKKTGKTITCAFCDKETYRFPSQLKHDAHFCSLACRIQFKPVYAFYQSDEFREKFSGANNPNWKGGLSLEGYSHDFTQELRRQIRKRDKYTCQLCGVSGKQIHHIDYDKKNSNSLNLITLCHNCHPKTNFNRHLWIALFQSIRRGV